MDPVSEAPDDLPEPPADFDALRALVLARHETMPKRLAQVARYALDNPDEIALGKVSEIAGHADVQPSTLIRFAQAIGYSGFSDLQKVFRSRLRDRWPDYRERLHALRDGEGDGSTGDLLGGFAEASITSLRRLQESVRDDDLRRAAALLDRAGTIYLLGQRRAFPVASYLAYSLAKLGLRATLLDNVASMLPEQADTVGPGDVLLAISFTPYTPSTVETASALARRGVPVVAITDSPFSPLTPAASVWLEVAEADHGAFRTLSASMCLALALAVAVGERRDARS